jgi:hypothetical protein
MHPDSVKYTAFTTPIGNFEFLVAPFGICNIPAEFACMGAKILNDLDFAETYVDDVTKFSNEFDQHLKDLQILFDILRKYNIKLNPKKCKFFRKEIKILCHILNQYGISTDPDKVNALLKMPFPATIKELYSFAGLVSYFRKFIIDTAQV